MSKSNLACTITLVNSGDGAGLSKDANVTTQKSFGGTDAQYIEKVASHIIDCSITNVNNFSNLTQRVC